jgi:hypothetical protein
MFEMSSKHIENNLKPDVIAGVDWSDRNWYTRC